jgi:hypothetical protein
MDVIADFPTLLAMFKALGNDSRLKLLGLVARREHSVQELATLLALTEPTASHHLAVLKALGFVRLRADGNTHLYAFEPVAMRRLASSILGPDRIRALAAGIELTAWDRRVLGNFVSADGRLKEIPASRKKRRIILVWLLADFEPGRRYPEVEVNALIERHHEDCATLRRELIGYRMLAREHGIYWRLDESEWRVDEDLVDRTTDRAIFRPSRTDDRK